MYPSLINLFFTAVACTLPLSTAAKASPDAAILPGDFKDVHQSTRQLQLRTDGTSTSPSDFGKYLELPNHQYPRGRITF